MARLQRMTLAAYHEVYCLRQFCENHLAWVQNYQSELVNVTRCNHHKLFKVEFSDRTSTILDHNTVIFVQRVPGTIRNF